MGVSLDFSNVAKREPLPEGIYNVVLEEMALKTSKTDKPMLAARFKEPETGTAIFENFVLTPDALWKLQSFCSAVGIDSDEVTDTDEIVEAAVGTEVQVKVVQREYNGNITNSIKSYIMG
jgi:hypothetical protein